jgi:hypothetical protein
MECRAAVMARAARRLIARVGAVLLLCFGPQAFAADRLVLIVSAGSPVAALNSLEIQKLFLGLTVSAAGEVLHPLRNESDDLTRQIFFQSVISMSETTYERRVLGLTLQQGRTAPPRFHNPTMLLEAVANDPAAVSYAWAADVAKNPRIKMLRVIWHE